MKVDKPTLSQLFDYYGDLLTAKQRECFDLYCNEDDTLAEIAELLGISRQGVFDAVRRSEEQLLRLEAVTGCLARERKIAETAQLLRALADQVRSAAPAELPGLADRLAAAAEAL
jgi:predicted DNA-binding protein YlxM (UPF0122 family)